MMQPAAKWNDAAVERAISTLLRAGLILAAGMVLAGGLWYLIRYGSSQPDYRVFRGEPSDLRTLSGILRGVVALRPRDFIQFGLVVLIATPVARVAFSVFAFAKQRDRTYVVITLIVMTMLLYSLFGGASSALR